MSDVESRLATAESNSKREKDLVWELTASGRGAICVLLVHGIDLRGKLSRFFRARNNRPLDQQFVNRPIYGHWGQEDVILWIKSPAQVGKLDGMEIDPQPMSLEIHCHGGEFAKQKICSNLESAGIGFAGALSPEFATTSAEQAFIELPHAMTRKTAAILLWQTRGVLDDKFEEIEFLLEQGKKSEALLVVDELLQFSDIGLHLIRPWKIAVAGAANAGKSSLINRIVGFQRSIVMDMPGTTRDLVTVETAIGGWPVQLTDTAGLRASSDRIEEAGIDLATQAIFQSDLILEVVDGTNPQSVLQDLGPDIDHHSRTITVSNKSDLVDSLSIEDKVRGSTVPQVSALTGLGLEELLAAVARKLVPVEPKPDDAVPFAEEHIEWLKEKRNHCLAGSY